jgi:hypothetical protein
VVERAGEPAFADAGRPFDDQVLRLVDPAASDQCLEQCAVEPAGGAVIDCPAERVVAFYNQCGMAEQ